MEQSQLNWITSLNVWHRAGRPRTVGLSPVKLADRPPPAQFAMQMESFARCVKEDQVPEVTGQDGIDALRALLTIYES